MANSKVNILGTDYEIVVKKYGDDEAFERRSIDGYCDYLCLLRFPISATKSTASALK